MGYTHGSLRRGQSRTGRSEGQAKSTLRIILDRAGKGRMMRRVSRPSTDSLQERFWSQVNKGPECWVWTGARGTQGYGAFTCPRPAKYGRMLAHRFAFMSFAGPMGAGLRLGHKCGNRLCVRPEHLEPVPYSAFSQTDVKEARFWAKVDKSGECWLWKGSLFTNGYGAIRWEGRNRRAHRVAWELVNGPIPDGLLACHTCDVPACCNPAHLFLGTHADNMADMIRKGRGGNRGKFARRGINQPPHVFGERHPRALLTEPQVLEIRRLWAEEGYSLRRLAKMFQIHFMTVKFIVSRKTWKHI